MAARSSNHLRSALAGLVAAVLAVPAMAVATAPDIVGTDGDDRLVGGPAGERIRGLAGDDKILGNAGRDWISAGVGDDHAVGGPDPDRLVGKSGNDDLFAAGGDDVVLPGFGNDAVYGGPGEDIVGIFDYGRDIYYAGRGNDIVSVDPDRRADTIRCGPGRDHLTFHFERSPLDSFTGCEAVLILGSLVRDRLIGTPGPEKIRALAGDDELRGKAGSDLLRGGRDDDALFGGVSSDRLFGGSGSDVVRGQDGDDHLRAGGPRVRLYGGPGADTLRASSVDPGTDYFACGAGGDLLVYDGDIDRADMITGCERVVSRGADVGSMRSDPPPGTHRPRACDFALAHRLPTTGCREG